MRSRAVLHAVSMSLRQWGWGGVARTLAIAIGYGSLLVGAGMLAVAGADHLIVALVPATSAVPVQPAAPTPAVAPSRPALVIVHREAVMSIAAGRGGREVSRVANPGKGPGMGTMLRSPWRSEPPKRRSRDEFDDDDEEERRPTATYRTLCVRMCDGYYFPVSHATGPERLARDAQTCQSQCGSEARLFVHRNPGEAPEQMVDLQGRAYTLLPNAFRYRTQYVSDCKCRPDPWEPEAKERHRVYALVDAARKGDRAAKVELKALEKTRAESLPRVAAGRPQTGDGPSNPAPVINGERPMGLGVGTTPRPAPPSGGLPEWARRAFSNY